MLYQLFITNFVTQYKWTFAAYMLIVVLFFPLESILLPHIYSNLINVIKTQSRNHSVFNVFENIKNMNFMGVITILIGVWTVITIAYTAKLHVESMLFPEYLEYLRTTIFEKLLYSHMDKYTDVDAGDYLTRVLEYTKTCSELFKHILTRFIPELIITLAIMLYMTISNPRIGYILITCFILIVAVHCVIGKELTDVTRVREIHFNKVIGGGLHEQLDNLMNIYINKDVSASVLKNNLNEAKQKVYNKSHMALQEQIIILCESFIVVAYGASLLNLGEDAIKEVLILGQYLSNTMRLNSGVVYMIISKMGILEGSRSYMEGLLKSKTTGTIKNGITVGQIDINNVSYSYDNKTVLRGVSLRIEGGSKICLKGRSGSGKTTLMKLLLRLYQPTSGSIFIDGIDIKDMDIEYLREEVNYMTQRTNLFNSSVLSNMSYGSAEVSVSSVVSMLVSSGLIDVFSDLSGGVNGLAGVNGGSLSGGMQKVTLLIRVLLRSGSVKILDEPLAGLDTKTKKKVMELIMKETKGKTLIVISHDAAIMPYMDKIIDMQNQ